MFSEKKLKELSFLAFNLKYAKNLNKISSALIFFPKY